MTANLRISVIAASCRLLIVALFFSLAMASQALGLKAVPPPGHSSISLFVGNYGETFEFPNDDIVETDMHNTIEDVRVHKKFQTNPASGLSELVKIPILDYQPENFEKLHLQELLVIPKDGPNNEFKTIAALKTAVLQHYAGLNLKYVVLDPRQWDSNWPVGSFEIVTTSPYHRWEIFSESLHEFYDLSAGVDPAGMDAESMIAKSLAKSLSGSFPSKKDEFKKLVPPWQVIALWLGINGIFLIIAWLPIVRWRRRLKILGFSLLGFCNGMYFYAYLLGLIEYSLSLGLIKKLGDIDTSAIILAAIAAVLMARGLRSINFKTMCASIVLTASWLVKESLNSDTATQSFSLTYIEPTAFVLFIMGFFIALVFGSLLRLRQEEDS